MRILLLHPEDNPLSGPWAQQTWDRVVDLAQAGANAYQRWGRAFGCGVEAVGGIDLQGYRRIRRLLEVGRGRLMDDQGLDWWELISIGFDQQVGSILALRKFADSLQAGDQVFASREGFHADALGQMLGKRVRCFFSGRPSLRQRSGHYWSLTKKFSVAQLGEIFWDKYDSDYRIRGRLSFGRTARTQPMVLLPSAYVNVSRMGIRYAEMLPDTEFLLVTTRPSGRMESLPSNVKAEKLAAYASDAQAGQAELSELLWKWEQLRAVFGEELAILDRLGTFAGFSKRLRVGLGIRNAWLQVFETEPIESVLCCDDTNAYTHIPLLLAKHRGLPTLTCHHGALDAGHLIKKNHADLVLAKGPMEHDYLTRVCGVREDEVEIGGPAQPAVAMVQRTGQAQPPWIVFFSEPYEIIGGRPEEFYRDLLPPLAKLAEETGRELVIKLHPMESARERRRLVERVEPFRHQIIRIVAGPLSEELLQKTWFAITVLSTAAMDCALRGVPCFLCGWLEYFSCGYGEQYCRFGAGVTLQSAADIAGIPETLETSKGRMRVWSDLSSPIASERLRELLSGGWQRGGRRRYEGQWISASGCMRVGNLLVRADASVQMGTGHVMRCLALAQAWQDAGGEVVFAVGESSPAIEKRLRAERIHVVPVQTLPGSAQDSMRLGELASHYRPGWVVVDGYQFSTEYHASIRLRGCRVLVVDDCGSCGPNGADMVLNQNLHAREGLYRNLSGDAELLLGPKFAMLRREFGRWRDWRREIAAVGRKILITMGGSDPDNISAQVCEALRELRVDGVEIRIAVGSSNPHLDSLHSIAKKWGGAVRVEQNVSDMPELMAWADVAISSAGSTCWEICMLGLPSVLLVLAENQRPVAEELSRMGIAIDASPDEEATRESLCARVRSLLLANGLRREMSQRGYQLVDGCGAERVVGAMKDFAVRGESGAPHEDMVPMHAAARKRGKGVGV